MKQHPVIGILSTRMETEFLPAYYTTGHYIEQIEAAGGIPVQLPLTGSTCDDQLHAWAALCDGVLLPGGGDLDPALYGQELLPELEQRTSPYELRCQKNELAFIHLAAAANRPMLGICLGQQAVNVAFGGELYQDLPTQCPGDIAHRQPMSERAKRTHDVTLAPGTLLREVVGEGAIRVNTFHHQAVSRVAPGFVASATAPDGVIEGIEPAGRTKRILCVQWHPENLADAGRPEAKALFRWLIKEACT